ncbi:MAG: internal scaffolding protein [Microvirus sp.]|nr:MAG: internal scaffolding protein [Microvirus sp.]
MIKVHLRTAYNYDTDKASEDTGISFLGEVSLTQQSASDETDINTIVRRFGLTGELPDTFRAPQYGDFTEVVDYQTAMNAVRAAEESFMSLPGEVRYEFNNDPQRLMEFLANDGNREKAREMGLLQPAPEVTRDAVKAIDELAEMLKPVAK